MWLLFLKLSKTTLMWQVFRAGKTSHYMTKICVIYVMIIVPSPLWFNNWDWKFNLGCPSHLSLVDLTLRVVFVALTIKLLFTLFLAVQLWRVHYAKSVIMIQKATAYTGVFAPSLVYQLLKSGGNIILNLWRNVQASNSSEILPLPLIEPSMLIAWFNSKMKGLHNLIPIWQQSDLWKSYLKYSDSGMLRLKLFLLLLGLLMQCIIGSNKDYISWPTIVVHNRDLPEIW